ncbi:MAG: type II secretion system F family protein [Rhizobiaceae bacterium]|nr:type II secretion system F family protein [Rhizobiaceae bacterium]
MFGFDPVVIIFVALSALAVGGIGYTLLFPSIERERNAERRLNTISREAVVDQGTVKLRKVASQATNDEQARRRKNLEASMKAAEKKRENRDLYMKKPPLQIQMKQAGMKGDMKTFWLYSVVCGLAVTALAIYFGLDLTYAPAALLVGTLGLPRWYVARRRKKRVLAFLNEFPNALDVMVRAVKSGLPLNDGIRLLASESAEPVRTEFQRIVDAQSIGKSTPQACIEMQETMPCPEAAFFGIVIQIQSQAGGNLSEALGNLSKVLRDRKKMKAKVQALAMEAKASAYIIGALPFIVSLLVYLSSPTYIMPLFTTSSGHITLAVSAVWMTIGIFVMKQMINFDM